MNMPKTILYGDICRAAKRMAAVLVAVTACGNARAATYYFAGDGSALNAAKYSTSSTGPFTSSFISGSVLGFSVANGTGTGATMTIGGISATESFTLTSFAGTISNTSNGIVDLGVASGKTVDFGGQGVTASTTAGYTKSGAGTFGFLGSTYGGGFTLNAGTIVAEGINVFGVSTTSSLTINGGTVAANASRAFTSAKFATVSVGGDFQIGALASTVALSSNTANISFASPVTLGATSRTVTIGANGVYAFSGVVSGAPGSGLTVAAVSGATGNLVLSNANIYTGATTINGGTLLITNATGSGTGSGAVNVNAGVLGGGGTSTGAVTVANGATIIPSTTGGSTIGKLTVGDGGATTGLTLNGALQINLGITSTPGAGTNYSQVNTVGALTLSAVGGTSTSSLTLNATANSGLVAGQVLYIALNDGIDPVVGTFKGQAEGSTVTDSLGDMYTLSYVGSGDGGIVGNDISLTVLSVVAVPEPATVLGGLLLVGALGWHRRQTLGGWLGRFQV